MYLVIRATIRAAEIDNIVAWAAKINIILNKV